MNIPTSENLPDTSHPLSVRDATRCRHVYDAPAYLLAQYARLAFVSGEDDLTRLGQIGADTLIVSSDWLLWQTLIEDGRHAVLLEYGGRDWDPGDMETDMYLRSADWMYVDGRDVTKFDGVSLGHKLLKPVYRIIADCTRLTVYVNGLIDRFQPRAIDYADMQTDHRDLDPQGCFDLIAEICTARGLQISDQRAAGTPMKSALAVVQNSREPVLRRFANAAIWRVLDFAGRLRLCFYAGAPRVLFLTTHLSTSPLIRSLPTSSIAAGFLARWFPRKRDPLYLARAVFRGAIPMDRPKPRLDAGQRRAIDAIRGDLRSAWEQKAAGTERQVRRFVETNILATEALDRAAEDVLWARQILTRFKPRMIVTDGLQNSLSQSFVEVARGLGVETAAMWHAHYMFNTKLPVFGCDPRIGEVADYCFSWGQGNEDWLDRIGANVTPVRIGSLVSAFHDGDIPRRSSRENALVLQYPIPKKDLAAPSASEFLYFVETVGFLQDLGYKKIRFKLHPDVHRKIPLYRRIAAHYALDCEIEIDGAFVDHIAWSDFVIGPVSSGAALEVIAAGKTYYPVIMHPTSIDMHYARDATVYEDMASLKEAIADKLELDQTGFVDYFTSVRQFPSVTKQFWVEIEGLLNNAAASTQQDRT